MAPWRALLTNPRRLPTEVRDVPLLPDTERVPPALLRSGLSDEACGELVGVSEGRAGEYPRDQWINLIWDGASNHWTAAIRQWARSNKVRLFPTPTHASHLNPVECHAGDLQKLALAGESYTTPEAVGQALDSAVRYRNE